MRRRHGYEARDELWTAPETLPTAAELEDPDAYEARQDEFKVEDIDFDTELQKLLDGGLMKASPTAVNLPPATNLIHNTPRFVIAH